MKSIAFLSLLVMLITGELFAQDTPGQSAYDQMVLNDGTRLQGVIVDETALQIRFQFIVRRPGVRTMVFEALYERQDISSITRAAEPGRSAARKYLADLLNSKKREEDKLQAIVLNKAPWIEGGKPVWHYQGPYFELLSNAQESLVRLVCVRLDAIFAAYVNTMGKRITPEKPVRVVLFKSLAEFRNWQQKQGMSFLNPAVYDARSATIYAGTDLDQHASQLQELHNRHQQQLKELETLRQKIDKHFGGKPTATIARQMQQMQQQLISLNSDNDVIYARLQAAFFATLYHEAFHAYLDRWVYPADQYQVPRWLNEGLAQLFENAFIEIDELRLGRLDEERLKQIQDAVRQNRFMPLRELLQTPPQLFFVRHTQENFESNRQYDASWALAHFLTFELKLTSTPGMEEYVRPAPAGQDIQRFEKLVNMPLEKCESLWKQYLLRLRPDGSLRP